MSADHSQVSSAAIDAAIENANRRQLLGHPMGLFLLFLVEMWERFSYYGMRGILVLYLTSPTSGMRNPAPGAPEGFNPGPGWSDADANNAYGWYTGLAYLSPILGGMIADKLIGTHRSMLVGGLLIALGHIVLGISGLGGVAGSAYEMTVFVMGLALIVLGTGHFKPSVSVMVGQLYKHGDARRETAFGIFYMGINLGSALQTYIVGTLGERVGWHWGFGAAAVGMILGLILYMVMRAKLLKGIGDPPANGRSSLAPIFIPISIVIAVIAAAAFHTGLLKRADVFISSGPMPWIIGLAALLWASWFTIKQRPEDRGPVASIFIFMLFNAVFWLSFEQAGSSINIFTDRFTDRFLGSFQVPTTWFQSVNPWLIVIFAPITGVMWTFLSRKNANPSQPYKISIGLILVGLGYLFMVWAALQAKEPAKAQMWLICATYFVHTMGEIVLSPTGLSYVTKAAPREYTSLLMGIWFISSFMANLGAGKVAAMVQPILDGQKTLPWHLDKTATQVVEATGKVANTQADFFFLFVITSCGAGLLILVLGPFLKKLTGGRDV
ncbi:MAG TPA: peptide MFS transporter [Phycisphaerales bacterium]|nr:peptide MFS transporter [Phycisphaerales bacterium]